MGSLAEKRNCDARTMHQMFQGAFVLLLEHGNKGTKLPSVQKVSRLQHSLLLAVVSLKNLATSLSFGHRYVLQEGQGSSASS